MRIQPVQYKKREEKNGIAILFACVRVCKCVFFVFLLFAPNMFVKSHSVPFWLASVRFGSRTTKIGFQTISLLNFNPSEMKNVTFDFFRLLLSSSYENKWIWARKKVIQNKWQINEWMNECKHQMSARNLRRRCRTLMSNDLLCTFGKWSRLPLEAMKWMRNDLPFCMNEHSILAWVEKNVLDVQTIEYVRSVFYPFSNNLNSLLLNVVVFCALIATGNGPKYSGSMIEILMKR